MFAFLPFLGDEVMGTGDVALNGWIFVPWTVKRIIGVYSKCRYLNDVYILF